MPTSGLEISLSQVMDLLVDAVCVVDPDGRFLFVSAAGEGIFGYTPAEMLGHRMIEFVHADDRQRTLAQVEQIVAGSPQPNFSNRYLRKDGQSVYLMWSARWSPSGQVRVAVARDVTALRQAEGRQAAVYAISEAAYTAADLQALFFQVHNALMRFLPARRFCIALRDAATDELRFSCYRDPAGTDTPPVPGVATLSAEVMRRGVPLLVTPESRADLSDAPWGDMDPDARDWLGVPLFGEGGAVGVLSVQSQRGDAAYVGTDTELLQFVATQVSSAVQRKQAEARLQHMAGHDSLTGLPNRALLDDRLHSAVARARRDGSQLALLYLDLDRFKEINDTLGHTAGDRVLAEVARRLLQCVRASDTAGRLGGDEFLLLLNDVQSAAHAEVVAAAIREAVGRPFQFEGQPVAISPSIGIVLFPSGWGDSDQLLQRADAAMYSAKKQGGNQSWVASSAVEDNPPAPPESSSGPVRAHAGDANAA